MNNDTPEEKRTEEPALPEEPKPAAAEGGKKTDLEERLSQLEQELMEMENCWKRALADLDNYRKRFAREFSRQCEDERARIMSDFLAIVDNLERALRIKADETAEPFREGVRAIHAQMTVLMGRYGVLPIKPEGQKFDVSVHEVMGAKGCEDVPEGTIVEVLQTGYTMNGRLLRPARVIIAAAPIDKD
jgi:molecular chaperone GrpE